MKLKCGIIDFGSIEHKKSIELRRKILRQPLGLDFSEVELINEDQQIHITCNFGNELIGVLILVILDPLTIKMRQVAVDNDMQGKGVGKALVKFAEQWTLENNYSLIELNARETAVPFYLKLDYSITSDKFFEVGIPHYRMIKEIFK